jgi:hypothetical protein
MYLNLTQIKEHFGMILPAEFIVTTLGVPNDAGDKKAKFWLPERVPVIGKRLAEYAVQRGALPVSATSMPKTAAASAPVADENSDLF